MVCATHALASERSWYLSDNTCKLLQRSNTTFYNMVRIDASRSYLWQCMCRQQTKGVALVDFFLLLFFFSHFSVIKYKSFFYLFFISNLVLILLITIYFYLYLFSNWLFFNVISFFFILSLLSFIFNFISQHLILIYSYVKFGPFFYCYLFCF